MIIIKINVPHIFLKNGTDILLSDSKIEYNNNNLSLCEANCKYQGYDTTYKQSICDCKIKNNMEYKSDI